MYHCVRGSLVFWLLVMTFIGASLGTAYAGKNLERNNGRRAEITDRGSSLDSPTDVLWRDRLLIEDTQPSPSDTNSGLLVRRITPKSVFIAPSFSGCSEGYRQDGMGRCVKLVKVNQAAQLDFILQKLNSMYAPSHNNNNNNNKNENSGPFHVSLPLGGLDNYSISSNNKTPNDKEKQKITSTDNKHSVEEISSDNRNNSSSISNSETNTKKTELLHIINIPSTTTTKSSQITTIKPQQNNNNNSNTVVNNHEETTTSIFTTDAIVEPTTLHSPVESPEQNQHTLIQNNFDSTVKREPQNNNNNNENKDLNTKKPFVIVVANSTYHPFESKLEEHLNPNTEETIPVIGYDYNTVTTTEATNKGIQTTTDDVIQDTTILSTIFSNNSDSMETVAIDDSFTTIFTTTMKTTLSNEQPSTYMTTTETTPFDTSLQDSSLYFNTQTTTTVIPNTSTIKENEEIGEENEDTDSEEDEEVDIETITEDVSSIFGAVIHVNSNNNKNIRESSRIPPLKFSEIPPIPVNLHQNTKPNCNYPSRNTESNYGHSNINCEPEITTVRYPVRTTTSKQSQNSYFIRFPIDNINSQSSSSVSSSSSLVNNGYKNTNSYVRFPEQSSSNYGSSSSSYGTKLWNSEPVSASSTMWYPQSWFPFIQPQRTWSHDDENNNNNHRNQPSHNQPMSTMYHKQYHQHHVLPQSVPSWLNTHSTWPQRD